LSIGPIGFELSWRAGKLDALGNLVRWEKKAENLVAAVDHACAYYTLQREAVFG
jgi:hypothetical protein